MNAFSFTRAITIIFLSNIGTNLAWPADFPAFASGIRAGKVVAIADGDFVAQSYATGKLAPLGAGYRDTLAAIYLTDDRIDLASIEVSNSVTSPPEALELTGDGRRAFVVERLARRQAGDSAIKDLAPGRHLFAVDISRRGSLELLDTLEIASLPEALDVVANPSDKNSHLIAVVANSPEGSQLQIADFVVNSFAGLHTFDLKDFVKTDTPGHIAATNVQWHPSGRFLAINFNRLNRVVFLRVKTEEGVIGKKAAGDGRIILSAWGQPVEVGADPFVGRFTPDGRHYLTSDWGRNFEATTLEKRLPSVASRISVIRLADTDKTGDQAIHRRLGGAATDLSAEGIAISPDGRLIATVNMRGTALPSSSPKFTREASVTLLTFDSHNGRLSKIADYPFAGMLPEGGSFDLTGDHFLATVFQYQDGKPAGGGLEVFRVNKGEYPSLERLGRLPLPHGVHHVVVAP